jgi:hypothetical protein
LSNGKIGFDMVNLSEFMNLLQVAPETLMFACYLPTDDDAYPVLESEAGDKLVCYINLLSATPAFFEKSGKPCSDVEQWHEGWFDRDGGHSSDSEHHDVLVIPGVAIEMHTHKVAHAIMTMPSSLDTLTHAGARLIKRYPESGQYDLMTLEVK